MTTGLFVLLAAVSATAQNLDRPPINYAKGPADNPVARLNERLAKRELALDRHDEFGYLPAALKHLGISPASQTLVFSKTSLQSRVISPRTPRALYFNDDVFVGYCQDGDLLELSAADRKLGAAFYTLRQDAERPKFARQNDNCMQCHGSGSTHGFPGHLVRSLHVGGDGRPFYSAGSFRTDPASPFAERWGGWYVTGTHGAMRHRGNTVYADRADAEVGGPRAAGQNVTDLRPRFDTAKYLTPHSDLVALLVLEHQADMHTRLSRAALDARLALADQAALNAGLGEPTGKQWDSTKARLRNAVEIVVDGLLFAGEAPLAAPVAGTSGFAAEFAARGPHDQRGRSLREFDLRTRMFRYPCSYLIHSAAFTGLPEEVRIPTLTRLCEILTAATPVKGFERLAAADRRAILEIVRDTVPNLPAAWPRPQAP